MKPNHLLRAVVLVVLMISLIPAGGADALVNAVPPADFFQLPWDQGIAWYAIDGIDNGTKRPLDSSHQYTVGGAIDFAPRTNMVKGEDTSNFWVTAAAPGTVVGISTCHVILDHGNGWVTQYQFLANLQVNLGQFVDRNQRLGIIADGVRDKFCIGSTYPDIPHLHFMLRPTMIGATFAGWLINYYSFFNSTTFTKDGVTVGLYRPLINTFDSTSGSTPTPTPATTESTPTTTGTQPTPTPGGTQSTPTPTGTLPTPNGTQSTPTPTGTLPTPTGTQSTPTPTGTLPTPTGITPTSTGSGGSVDPDLPDINIGQTTLISVKLNNVPLEGYTSAEFTCTYDPTILEVSNFAVTDLFGADPAVAINGPQSGSFVVAIAGSHGNKATTSGTAFTFNVKGLQAGQVKIQCKVRVSTGNNELVELPTIETTITVNNDSSTPTFTPIPSATSVSTTATPTSPANGWLTFTNQTYGFQFNYPPDASVVAGGDDNFTRIDLPFVQGTNLSEKYLEVIVVENANPCQSPLATQSILETSENVTINGITFLKQTGQDGTAGHINKWTAYSAIRDNACISLDFILRAANPGVFTTPPPLYDEAAESAVFEQIVSAYTWLSLTPTNTPVPSENGMLTGQVFASKTVTINLYTSDLSVAATVTVNPDGTFTLTAPAGTYTAVASANGFLNAQASVTLTAGATTTLTAINLPAGDIDDNNVIDQFDALSIGMNYNAAEPSVADLNNDGIINVLDLEALASNYRKTSPIVWQ